MTADHDPHQDELETVRARLEAATRDDPRLRFRILVAAHVLLIVDRQIGRGEGALSAEWDRLGQMVKDNPGAAGIVASLRTAVDTCEKSIADKLASGEAEEGEEALMRQAILGFIRTALLEKLQLRADPAPAEGDG